MNRLTFPDRFRVCIMHLINYASSCKDATSSEHMNKKGAEKIERDAEGCLTSQVDAASSSKDSKYVMRMLASSYKMHS